MKVVNCQPHISPQNDEKRPVCNYNVLCWVYMQTYPALNTTLAVTTVAVWHWVKLWPIWAPVSSPVKQACCRNSPEISSPIKFCEAETYQTDMVKG